MAIWNELGSPHAPHSIKKWHWDAGHRGQCKKAPGDAAAAAPAAPGWPMLLPELELVLDQEYIPKAHVRSDEVGDFVL